MWPFVYWTDGPWLDLKMERLPEVQWAVLRINQMENVRCNNSFIVKWYMKYLLIYEMFIYCKRIIFRKNTPYTWAGFIVAANLEKKFDSSLLKTVIPCGRNNKARLLHFHKGNSNNKRLDFIHRIEHLITFHGDNARKEKIRHNYFFAAERTVSNL